jgi:hypothetical protein
MYIVVTNITDLKSIQKDIDKPTYLFITCQRHKMASHPFSSLIATRHRCDIDLPHLYWNVHPLLYPATEHSSSVAQ